MLLDTKKRVTIMKSLDLQIEVIENQIQIIKQKPDSEYESQMKFFKPFYNEPLTDDTLKKNEVDVKRKEIDELNKLKNLFDDGKNNILVIPREIKLCLSDNY